MTDFNKITREHLLQLYFAERNLFEATLMFILEIDTKEEILEVAQQTLDQLARVSPNRTLN